MKTKFKFTELSNLAQIKAVYDYFLGWAETHDENDMDFNEVYDLLLGMPDDEYLKDGTLIEETEDET